jgi:exopolyphosphatase/guanosine-5'-triphosphate,3'-diphosphate pyrophosphatase
MRRSASAGPGAVPTTRQRVAALDLGTNSFHLLVADLLPDGSFRVVDRLKEMVGLGRDGLDHHLDDAAFARAMAALSRLKLLCVHQGVESILAYATSAIREADNGGELLQRAHDELGISALAISGEMEAELVAQAVQHGMALGADPSLVIDVGGGSVELIILDRERVRWLASRKLGVARLAAGFQRGDRLSEVEARRLEAFLERELADTVRAVAAEGGVRELIGTSGTVEAVAAMVAARRGEEVSNGYAFAAADVRALWTDLAGSDRAERLGVPGLDYKRVDYIVPGLALLDALLRRTGIPRLRLSRHGLREGILLRHLRGQAPELGLLAAYPDPRRRAVHQLARRYDWHQGHSEQVARLALRLFDALRGLHGLEEADRELLEYAALLHDVGHHVSHRAHHKHSLYLIRHADLAGFAPVEVTIMALVARYHRGVPPRASHRRFVGLTLADQLRVRKLAGLLRVADGLDRSHYQNVIELAVAIRKKRVVVTVSTKADPELETWGGMRRRQLLEEVLDRRIEIMSAGMEEATDVDEVEQPSAVTA